VLLLFTAAAEAAADKNFDVLTIMNNHCASTMNCSYSVRLQLQILLHPSNAREI
jgi:hypothetical protein